MEWGFAANLFRIFTKSLLRNLREYADNTRMWEAPFEGGQENSLARQCFAFLRAVPILQEVDESVLWMLAQRGTEETFDPGELVLSQGEDPDEKRFYIIRSGSADVVRRDSMGMERVVARLACGGYFGELGLLTNQARNATIRVHGDWPLQTFSFDALTFHSTIADNVLVFRVIRERRRTRHQPGPGVTSVRLSEIEMFRSMAAHDLEFIMRDAEQQWFESGMTIFEQGDPGDRFYIVLDGGVEIVRDDTILANLFPGDFFGETALLFDMPRTASVRTTRRTLMWSISRAGFQRVIGHYLLANHSSRQTVTSRLRAALQ